MLFRSQLLLLFTSAKSRRTLHHDVALARKDVSEPQVQVKEKRTSHNDLSHFARIEPNLLKVPLLDIELVSLRNQAHDANIVRREESRSLTRLEGVVVGRCGIGEVLNAA